MNRERLGQLIYWMRSFTEDELIQSFGRLHSSQVGDSHQQLLREYLENLKESGMLGWEEGRYILLNPAKGQRPMVV